VEELRASPLAFYEAVEEALQGKQLPGVRIERVAWQEGGVFSPRREYLRVRRRELVIDICGAPYGSGFFVSWWLGERPRGLWRLLAHVPALELLARLWFRPQTHYAIDTALMFQEAVHSAVLEVVDGLTNARGLRRLAEPERRPVLREFLS
jgi:hypothetical protein